MSEITDWLARARAGDRSSHVLAFAQLCGDLKRLAEVRGRDLGDTLSTTALVNEIYLKFSDRRTIDLSDRLHFLATAACAMRGLVVDHICAAQAQKRGGGAAPISLSVELAGPRGDPVDLLALEQALERLDAVYPQQWTCGKAS